MHEMGIAVQIMDVVMRHLPPDPELRVKRIRLRVGRLTAIVPHSLQACMDIVTLDTPARGAEVLLDEVPVRLACIDCGEESIVDDLPFCCRACDSGRIEIIGGRELIVEAIEV